MSTSTISEVLSVFGKYTGLRAFQGDRQELSVRCIPFGIPQLDLAIGGGVPMGRVTMLIGDQSSGKTFLSQQLMRSALRMNLSVVYYNAEKKADPVWFARTGVDISRIIVINGNIAEEVYASMRELVENKVGLIVVDSLAALVPISENDEEVGQQTMGLQARVNSKEFRKLMTSLSVSDTTVVIINQERESIGQYARKANPGGRAPTFYSSLTLNVRRGDWITKREIDGIDTRVGFNMIVRSEKNTIAAPWREVSLPFYYDGRIDIVESMFDLGIKFGVIKATGAWFTLHDGSTRRQGKENAIELYRSDREFLKELVSVIHDIQNPEVMNVGGSDNEESWENDGETDQSS